MQNTVTQDMTKKERAAARRAQFLLSQVRERVAERESERERDGQTAKERGKPTDRERGGHQTACAKRFIEHRTETNIAGLPCLLGHVHVPSAVE